VAAAAPTALEKSARRPAGARSTEIAYARLKQKVLDNEYPPGATVLEQDLAAELNLSRTPVREALVRLEQDGLVQIVPRHGARIAALSPADMREIYEVLMSLEPTAVELLARRRPDRAELAPLVAACDAMEEALEVPGGDLKAWAAADEAYHMHLASLCGNRRLAAMIMTVWEQAHRARMFTLTLRPLPKRSTQEHREVVEAILRGDVAGARDLYAAHRRRGGEELMSIIERHGFQRL
jgi:DNA-binding GntR family transcriptional regulator